MTNGTHTELASTAATAPITAVPIAAGDDPIFAVINAHRTLRGIYDDWCNGETPQAAKYRAADAAAWDALLATRPTTIAGVKALAGYFREIAEGWQADTQFLAAIEAACDHLAHARKLLPAV